MYYGVGRCTCPCNEGGFRLEGQFMARSMLFGEKLRRLRGSSSYKAVSVACGCSGEHVRRLEQNKACPNVLLALRLARHFGVPLDWLADDTQNWPPPATEEQRISDIIKETLTARGLSRELGPEEIELLQTYRRLGKSAKARLTGFLTGLAAAGKHNSS